MKRKGDVPATRKDLWALGTQITAMQADSAETKKVVRNMAVELSRTKGEVVGLREDFSSAMQKLESRLVGRMDAFMSQTLKVSHDQFWLIHRMDAAGVLLVRRVDHACAAHGGGRDVV